MTAELKSDLLDVGLLSSVYYMVLTLFGMWVVLSYSFIKLIPHSGVCLVLLLASPPQLFIRLFNYLMQSVLFLLKYFLPYHQLCSILPGVLHLYI